MERSWSSPEVLINFMQDHRAHMAFEVGLIICLLYFVFQKKYDPKRQDVPKVEEPTPEEFKQMLAEWQPQPLISRHKNHADFVLDNDEPPVVTSAPGAYIETNGKKLLNLATTNFLEMATNPDVIAAGVGALKTYGCGACGPRGFYGTVDTHMQLEARLAKFFGAEEGIIYSSGYATMPAVIPTFSGRGDLIVADAGVHHGIKIALELSRAEIIWFSHNNMTELEAVWEKVKEDDRHKRRTLTRRFVVVEGLYFNSGEIAPLKKIMELKQRFCFRLILDDSYGVGVLGATGRGTPEHCGVPTKDIELYAADLGHSLGSCGGFCVGTAPIVFHQRLNSSGYVFSASSPPYLVVAAHKALDTLEARPQLVGTLRQRAARIRTALLRLPGIVLAGDSQSPVIHLRLKRSMGTRRADEEMLQEVVDRAAAQGLALTRARYVPDEKNPPPPSIRLTVCAGHTEQELDRAAETLRSICQDVVR